MFAFAHTMFAPFMALALAYVGFLVVMGLRAATLRDVLLVRLPCRWMHPASPPVLLGKACVWGRLLAHAVALGSRFYKILAAYAMCLHSMRRGRSKGWRLVACVRDYFRAFTGRARGFWSVVSSPVALGSRFYKILQCSRLSWRYP